MNLGVLNQGTGYIYETLLRPYVSMREPYIDRSLRELHARAWDLALYYWQNCTSLGQTKFFEIVQFISAQFGKVTKANNEVWFPFSHVSLGLLSADKIFVYFFSMKLCW